MGCLSQGLLTLAGRPVLIRVAGTKEHRMRRRLWVFLLAIMVPVGTFAQETRGNISGTVRDNTGVIPGASVKVTNLDTNVTQNFVTNGSGYFEAPLLIRGSYEVTVQMQGYKAAVQKGITLAVGQRVDLSFTLDVG